MASQGVGLSPGHTLGKFQIVRAIGRGGMCEVFEARHLDLQKTVALKTLLPAYSSRPEVVERFVREGRAASRIRHRHAIEMFDVGEHDGLVYLAMEYLDGEDLSQRIKRDGALPVEMAMGYLLPVISAIVEAHEAGIVHRDLKPANIFLSVDRRGRVEPKVLDFGISKVADDEAQHQTATDQLLGTPFYMAPEQVQGARHTSPASDQYSLGVILYQSLTGALPFRDATPFETLQRIVIGQYVPPRAHVPSLPPELEAVVVRALSRDPSARYPSAAALGAALLPFASAVDRENWSHLGESAPPPSSPITVDLAPSVIEGTITHASGELSPSPASASRARPMRLLSSARRWRSRSPPRSSSEYVHRARQSVRAEATSSNAPARCLPPRSLCRSPRPPPTPRRRKPTQRPRRPTPTARATETDAFHRHASHRARSLPTRHGARDLGVGARSGRRDHRAMSEAAPLRSITCTTR